MQLQLDSSWSWSNSSSTGLKMSSCSRRVFFFFFFNSCLVSGLEWLEKLGALVRSLSLSFSSSTTLHDELGFLTAWQFQIKWYPAPPRVSIPKGQDRSCKPLEDPASEAPERHSHQIVLVKQVMKSSLGSREGKSDSASSCEEQHACTIRKG